MYTVLLSTHVPDFTMNEYLISLWKTQGFRGLQTQFVYAALLTLCVNVSVRIRIYFRGRPAAWGSTGGKRFKCISFKPLRFFRFVFLFWPGIIASFICIIWLFFNNSLILFWNTLISWTKLMLTFWSYLVNKVSKPHDSEIFTESLFGILWLHISIVYISVSMLGSGSKHVIYTLQSIRSLSSLGLLLHFLSSNMFLGGWTGL